MQFDDNVVLSTMYLREHILKDPENLFNLLPNSNIGGYIQVIQAIPFGVICFTEAGIRLYHSVVKEKPLHCDATGTIVSLPQKISNSFSQDKQLLYYALVVSHPISKVSVAIAEFVSADHSVPAVCNFLQVFRRGEAQIFGYGCKATPCHVITDRSRVLLLSFLSVYNEESLNAYLKRCFRIVTNSAEEEDFSGVFVLACISHVMKNAKEDLKRLL